MDCSQNCIMVQTRKEPDLGPETLKYLEPGAILTTLFASSGEPVLNRNLYVLVGLKTGTCIEPKPGIIL